MASVSQTPGSLPVAEGHVLAGKYRVERVLGVGGMGVVVAATHLHLDQKVAIKFMLEPGLQQPALVERFAREARAAVRLKSDHVARVLDVGVLDSGSPYMVMEYLEGSDLGQMLEQYGAMAIETAVDCVLQACDAVAEAHSLGIVHRDLKPRNLFWTQRNDGRALVKVLDFGISKHKTGGDLSLTRTTEIIGSPNYMSPEQFRAARAADERSDIWALGVILYELVTGYVPFPADSITQLTAMVLSEPPRAIQTLRADVPDGLVRAIGKCLEKDANLRFPSVAHLAAALQPFAPADARDLAARIARIGTGGRGARSGTLPFSEGPVVASGTSVNWAAGTGAAPPARGKKIAAWTVVALATVALGGGLAMRLRSQGTAAPAPIEPVNGSVVAVTPSVPTTAPPTTTLAPIPVPELAATIAPVVPTHAPSVSPAVRPSNPGARAAREHPDAGAPGPSTGEDPPRYRTTW